MTIQIDYRQLTSKGATFDRTWQHRGIAPVASRRAAIMASGRPDRRFPAMLVERSTNGGSGRPSGGGRLASVTGR